MACFHCWQSPCFQGLQGLAKTINSTKTAKNTSKKIQPAEGDKKKRKKVHRETYSSYIYIGVYPYNHEGNLSTIALKQVHPDTGISDKATFTDHLYSLLPLLAKPLLRLSTVLKWKRRLPRRLSCSLLRVIRRREERSTEKLTAPTSSKVFICTITTGP
jgi:hypothetical protein